MKDQTVITENMTRFTAMVEALMNKPDRVDRMGLVYGTWGLGKSTTIDWYFTNNPCFHVRTLAAWSRSLNLMVEDMLKTYRVKAMGRIKYDLKELIRVIKKNRVPLFVDEADRIIRKSILIETIRDIHDLSRIPIILVGSEDALGLLQRRDLGQVLSRISEVVEFKPLSEENIQNISNELCDLKCGLGCASFIREVTLGDFRLINILLTKVEDICKLNKASEISLSVAKEAAKALPSLDDMNRGSAIQSKKGASQRALRAVS